MEVRGSKVNLSPRLSIETAFLTKAKCISSEFVVIGQAAAFVAMSFVVKLCMF